MPTYRITEWHSGSDGAGPWHIDADDHTIEAGNHVFRRTALVLGRPRQVIVLRLPETAVRCIEIV